MPSSLLPHLPRRIGILMGPVELENLSIKCFASCWVPWGLCPPTSRGIGRQLTGDPQGGQGPSAPSPSYWELIWMEANRAHL